MTPQEAAQLVVCVQELRKAVRALNQDFEEIADHVDPILQVADHLDQLAHPTIVMRG